MPSLRRGLHAPASTPDGRVQQRLGDLEARPPAWRGDTGWFEVGSGVNGAPGWGGGWRNYAGTMAFRRLANGLVILEGELVYSAGLGGTSPIFTLPAGFRPRMRNHGVCGSGSAGATLGGFDINTSGAIDYATGSGVYFPLNWTFMAGG